MNLVGNLNQSSEMKMNGIPSIPNLLALNNHNNGVINNQSNLSANAENGMLGGGVSNNNTLNATI